MMLLWSVASAMTFDATAQLGMSTSAPRHEYGVRPSVGVAVALRPVDAFRVELLGRTASSPSDGEAVVVSAVRSDLSLVAGLSPAFAKGENWGVGLDALVGPSLRFTTAHTSIYDDQLTSKAVSAQVAVEVGLWTDVQKLRVGWRLGASAPAGFHMHNVFAVGFRLP